MQPAKPQHRHRRGISDDRSRDARSALAYSLGNPPQGQAEASHEAVKPEMHQAVIEVGTNVCHDIKEAREDIRSLRRANDQRSPGRTACCWPPPAPIRSPTGRRRRSIPTSATQRVVEDMQLIARANLVFGLHVHVGIEDRNTAIHIMNSMRYFLPHILALSHQFALLDGHGDRLQIVSLQSLRALPAYRHSRCFRQLVRLRDLRQPAGARPIASTTARRSGGTSGRIRSSTPRGAGVRHPDAARRNRRHRRADSGDCGNALQAARGEQELPDLRARADYRRTSFALRGTDWMES